MRRLGTAEGGGSGRHGPPVARKRRHQAGAGLTVLGAAQKRNAPGWRCAASSAKRERRAPHSQQTTLRLRRKRRKGRLIRDGAAEGRDMEVAGARVRAGGRPTVRGSCCGQVAHSRRRGGPAACAPRHQAGDITSLQHGARYVSQRLDFGLGGCASEAAKRGPLRARPPRPPAPGLHGTGDHLGDARRSARWDVYRSVSRLLHAHAAGVRGESR